ncbi:unnamed protein product [Closterium sp. NIES-54]
MFITLYFIVTHLPDSLRSVKDHFLSLDPTSLTVDLLEQHLLAAKTSAIAVGTARGTPRLLFFEGCSPSPLAPAYASAAAADVPGAEHVGAASASVKRHSGKHALILHPSSVPLRVPLPPPIESSLPEVPDPESDCARAASPTVSRLLATTIPDPSFEFAALSDLIAELIHFAAASRLDYASAFVAYQRQGVDYFQTFSPTPKMTSLQVLLHVSAQRDYELHSVDFSTAFLQGSLHEEIWLCRPPGFTGSFPAGTQWSLRRPLYGLRQAPREWHDTLRTTLAILGFAPSTADPSLFLRTHTSLPPFYVLVYADDLVFATGDTPPLTWVLQRFGFRFSSPLPTPLSTSHSLSAPPLDESVEPSGMGLVLGGRGPVVLTGHANASWVDVSATLQSSQGYTFSLGSGSISWRSTRSSLVLSSGCEAEIYAGAMAAQELRWLTNLLIDLGEQPRSPPVLYVDNKAMIALCQEHRLEHRTKHITLRYFLARELQQRGQLRLAYLTTRANTADIFTKAPPPGDHQRFSTVLGLVPSLPALLTA